MSLTPFQSNDNMSQSAAQSKVKGQSRGPDAPPSPHPPGGGQCRQHFLQERPWPPFGGATERSAVKTGRKGLSYRGKLWCWFLFFFFKQRVIYKSMNRERAEGMGLPGRRVTHYTHYFNLHQWHQNKLQYVVQKYSSSSIFNVWMCSSITDLMGPWRRWSFVVVFYN